MTIRDLIIVEMGNYVPKSPKPLRGRPSSVGSRYALAKAIGVSDSTISRFVSGERGLSMPVIQAICDELGLTLVKKER